MASASGAELPWAPADWWVCGEGFVGWLVPGDGVSPLAGVWATSVEREVEAHQDHLQTLAAGFGSSDTTILFSDREREK